jgi:hypothetical protein
VGPDKTACNFDLLEKKVVSKLRHTRSLVRDRRLSRGAILNGIAKMAEQSSGGKSKAIQGELQVLTGAFGVSHGDLRADPGFVVHGMKSKRQIESTIGTMLN